MASTLQDMRRHRGTAAAAIAEFGRFFQEDGEPAALLQEVTEMAAGLLGADYCGLFELLPQRDALLLRAGVGWRAGAVGRATVEAGKGSAAGATLHSGVPMIVNDVRPHGRFVAPHLLQQHRVASGVIVVIPGGLRPFGILGVYGSAPRRFTRDDVAFLEATAQMLAAAIGIAPARDEPAQRARLEPPFTAGIRLANGCAATPDRRPRRQSGQ
jgi:GAF domain-containing protein